MQVGKPAAAAAVAPFRGQHDEIECVRALHLQPLRAARARLVRRIERFHHHPFVPALERIVVERLRGDRVAGHEPGHAKLRRDRRGQGVEALGPATGHEVPVVAPQAVEKKHRQGHSRAHCLDVEDTTEAAHRVLERVGRPAGFERDRFAVENEIPVPRGANRRNDFRRGRGDFVPGARVEPHLVSALVDLQARSIELPLEGRCGDLRQRLGDVVRRLSEHRCERLEQRDRKAGKPFGSFGERAAGDCGNAAADHRRPAHRRGGHAGCRGDGFDHQSFERSLTELAEQKPGKKFPLSRRRPPKERGELRRAFGGRAGSAGAGDALERRIDLAQCQLGRIIAPAGGLRILDQRPADADLSLPGQPRKIRHADADLGGLKATQQVGDVPDLFAARRILADTPRGVDEFREQR